MSSSVIIVSIVALLSLYLCYGVQDGLRRRYRQYQQTQRQSLQLYRLRRQGDLLKLWLRHPKGQLLPKARPGQHLQLFYLNQQGQKLSRAYSLVNDCRQRGYYMLAIKIEREGQLTPLLAQTLEQGQLLECSYPRGHFAPALTYRSILATLLPGITLLPQQPLVLVAGGIGITPLLPMIISALAQRREVTLVYQARTAADLLQHAKLRRLSARSDFKYLPILSQPISSWRGRVGRITAAQLALLGGPTAEYLLCATANMVFALADGLAELGCHHVQHELFSAAHSTQNLTINLGSAQANSLGHRTILDALLASGIQVPYDCRGGSCGACVLRLVEGKCQQVLHSEYRIADDELLSCCMQATTTLQLDWPCVDTEVEQPLAYQHEVLFSKEPIRLKIG